MDGCFQDAKYKLRHQLLGFGHFLVFKGLT